MESNSAALGGSLTSKPTWSNTFGVFCRVGFFVFLVSEVFTITAEGRVMEKLDPSVAQQIAQAAIAFQQQRTGHKPQSVAVVLSGDTLLITLHGALSPAEKTLSQSPEGAARVQEFHRQLFANSADELRQEIKRITGVEVREATTEVETTTGTVVQVFTTGTMVQVFLLAKGVPASSWSGNGSGVPS
jgi:uncharacterized protein YbcI